MKSDRERARSNSNKDSAHIEIHYWRDELNKYDNAIADHWVVLLSI